MAAFFLEGPHFISMFLLGEVYPSFEIRRSEGPPEPAGQTGKANRELVFVYR
jgi:hypothetical protein